MEHGRVLLSVRCRASKTISHRLCLPGVRVVACLRVRAQRARPRLITAQTNAARTCVTRTGLHGPARRPRYPASWLPRRPRREDCDERNSTPFERSQSKHRKAVESSEWTSKVPQWTVFFPPRSAVLRAAVHARRRQVARSWPTCRGRDRGRGLRRALRIQVVLTLSRHDGNTGTRR